VILLDTHVLIWWAEDTGRLSERAASAIADTPSVLVSPISFWELGMLIERGRVAIDRDLVRWCRNLLAASDIEVAELTPYIAISAAQLPEFHGDPADRLLYATARELQIAMISKDEKIRSYALRRGDVAVVW
jgi:PIN domain nuclease of toxin-antitoxin system